MEWNIHYINWKKKSRHLYYLKNGKGGKHRYTCNIHACIHMHSHNERIYQNSIQNTNHLTFKDKGIR